MPPERDRGHSPQRWSPVALRRILSLYPPFLFGGIRVLDVAPDFSGARVRVRRSLLNRNLNGTVFGGTLYSAADPIYALLFWQLFAREGRGLRVWTKSAAVEFIAPVRGRVVLEFALPADLVERARAALDADGRFEESLRVEGHALDGTLCLTVETRVHLASR